MSRITKSSMFALVACALTPACAKTTLTPVNDASQTNTTSAAVSSEAATRPGESPSTLPTAATTSELPTKCELGTDPKMCMPPAAFARSLCAGEFVDVALSMFSKGTPWTRAFVVRDTHAWNVTSARSHRTKIARDEEVILLAKKDANPAGGMVIVGAAPTYDALRWDGSCVQLDASELTLQRPGSARAASITWSHLPEDTRRALLAQPKVKTAESAMVKACGPSTTSPKCDAAERGFRQSVVDAVRHGVTLPVPLPPPPATN